MQIHHTTTNLPALLVVHGGAVLLVARLVDVLTLGHVLRLALGLDLPLVARVEHSLALPVAPLP